MLRRYVIHLSALWNWIHADTYLVLMRCVLTFSRLRFWKMSATNWSRYRKWFVQVCTVYCHKICRNLYNCRHRISSLVFVDYSRYDLSKGDMHVLQKQMERLFALGYRWGSPYTQCLLQNLLDTIRYGYVVCRTSLTSRIDLHINLILLKLDFSSLFLIPESWLAVTY